MIAHKATLVTTSAGIPETLIDFLKAVQDAANDRPSEETNNHGWRIRGYWGGDGLTIHGFCTPNRVGSIAHIIPSVLADFPDIEEQEGVYRVKVGSGRKSQTKTKKNK